MLAMTWIESSRADYEKLAQDEIQKTLSTIIKEEWGDKQYLLRQLKERLSLQIPKNYTYKQIVAKIASLKKEKEFCELFQTKDFIETIMTFRNLFILEFFSNDELRIVGQELCKDRCDLSNRGSMINSIAKNSIEQKLVDLFNKLTAQKPDRHLIQQRRKWIVGPLGLLRSYQSRSWSGSVELEGLLESYLSSPSQFALFFDKYDEIAGFDWKKNVDDGNYKDKCVQLVLALFDDDFIVSVLNDLLDKSLIEIDTIKKFESLIASPYGIFREEYSGFDNLVNLIIENFDTDLECLESELRSEGLTSGSIEQRIQEECLRKNPKEIVEAFFGKGPNLIKLAERVGLVSLSRIKDKETLLQVVLLKLGFTFPPRLDGLLSYLNDLRKHKKQLESGTDDNQRRGLWNRVYSDLERMLRDLVLFFFSCLWQSKLEDYDSNEVRIKKLQDMLKEEFCIKKPIDVLTLGDLCDLLAHINKKIRIDSSFGKEVESVFKRKYIVPQNDLERLQYIKGSRTALTGIHPTKKGADPNKTLEKLLETCEKWSRISNHTRIFPVLIRTKEIRTNEFGITRLFVLDENGDEWIIKKSDMWIHPENAYFMLSNAERLLAIEPILVEKIW